MKKTILAALALAGTLCASATPQIDLSKVLGKLGGSTQTTETTTQTDTPQSTGSGLLESLQGIGNALGIIPSKRVDVEYLTGSWAYKKAAVAFKSDNFLKKAGGVAAAEKIESELEPYYKRLGFNKMTLTVNADSTFTMGVGKIKLNGTITADAETLTFNFRALGGRIGAGSMAAYVNGSTTNTMDITFDVTKLVELLTKVGSLTGSTSIKAITSLLSSYDGVTAGFTMTRTSN